MRVISGAPATLPEGVHAKVANYRHKIFVERLGWQLQTQNNEELDQFDRPDTIYVVAQDSDGRVSGCARLLPTNRPYLLGEIFPELLNGLPAPNSPEVWELSRFAAVDPDNPAGTARGQLSSTTAIKLLHEAIACAARHGAKHLISVSPIGIERLLRAAGVHAHRAGPPLVIGGHPIFACWIEIPSTVTAVASAEIAA
jgi:acyl homoserine lactone synthase